MANQINWNKQFKDKTLKTLAWIFVTLVIIVLGFGLYESKIKKVGIIEFDTSPATQTSVNRHDTASTSIKVHKNDGTIIGTQNNNYQKK